MKLITKNQIVKLHALLNNAGLLEDKKVIISNYTKQRTCSSKDLTSIEAKALIDYLEQLTNPSHSRNKMIRKIFAICRSIGWIEGDSPDDLKMNSAKVHSFIERKGFLKKPLKDYNKMEMSALVSQFESIQKNIERTKVNKGVKQLLKELDIKTEINH